MHRMKKLYMFGGGAVLLVLIAVGLWWYVGQRVAAPVAVMPDLGHEVVINANLPEEAQVALHTNIKNFTEALNENPEDVEAWLDLALQYNIAQDFDAARAVWEYLSDTAPQQTTSLHNLGNLYTYNLPDYPRAETYYREAISRNPTNLIHYFALHELYRYYYKVDTTAAVDVLNEVLQVDPDAPDVYLALAAYYRDEKHDTDLYVEMMLKARDVLERKGNTEKARQVEAEIARFR